MAKKKKGEISTKKMEREKEKKWCLERQNENGMRRKIPLSEIGCSCSLA